MPELPEVEAVTQRLRIEALGATIESARFLRPGSAKPQDPAVIEAALKGRRIEAIERRGKNILLTLENASVLRVHLRMTGNLYVLPNDQFLVHTIRAVFRLKGGTALVFNDPRALGRIGLHGAEEMAALMGKVGIEPLGAEFTLARFLALATRSNKPSKLFLMDQTAVAGLGNIYAAEALFCARMNPRTAIRRFSRAKKSALHQAILDVLNGALETEDYELMVYGRQGEPCRICGQKIRRIPQGGRSTYFCLRCQR